MVTIAEFTVPADDFPLGSLLRDLPGAVVELDRIVPTGDAVVPYVWVRNVESDDVDAAIGTHPHLTGMEQVDAVEDVSLYRTTWENDVQSVISCIAESDVSLLSTTGTEAEWVFKLRADDAESIAGFQRCARDYGIDAALTRLHSLTDADTGSQYDLTPEQRETLLLAFDEGYYDDPRRTTLQELADLLGISRTAVSARLKRGYRNLIATALLRGDDE